MRLDTNKAGAALAAATLLGLVVVDALLPHVSFAPLFALSPMIACAVLPAPRIAVFAAAAIAAAVGSLLWNDPAGAGQQAVRVLTVCAFSTAAVTVSTIRGRRERHVARLTVLAEVAQRAVLPVLPAHARHVDVAVRYQSATQGAVIGGDLYDCYHSRTHTRFLLGDVRGKGIAAVEQAARVIRAFRQASAFQAELDGVAEDMNDYLTPFLDDEDFVTAVLLDTTTTGHPQLVSAGHPPPLLIHPDGTTDFLEADTDLPLGLGLDYTRHDFTWNPGDRLMLYTDGLSEARNSDGEFLDLRTLGPLLAGEPIEAAVDRILDAARSHADGTAHADDVAVLLLEHTEVPREDFSPSSGEHDWRSSLAR